MLSVVDQTHLPNAVKDSVTGNILGWTHEVKMTSVVGSGGRKQEYVVALLYVLSSRLTAVDLTNPLLIA